MDANRIYIPQACAHLILAGTVVQATSCQSSGEASDIHGGSKGSCPLSSCTFSFGRFSWFPLALNSQAGGAGTVP